MSEHDKDEVLRQISEIKSHLVDKETFFPYNYKASYVWSAIAVVLTLGIVSVYEYSMIVGTLVMFVLISLGFVVEGILTKRVNEAYDIEDCTKRQRFIMMSFLMISLFLIIVSYFFAMQKLYVLILLFWLFLISFGYTIIGYVMNLSAFSKLGQFNMLVALGLLAISIYTQNLIGAESQFFMLVQAVTILCLAVIPTYIAWHQEKQEVGCSV